MSMLIALTMCAAAAIPPLTGVQRTALSTAHDGAAHDDEAFTALMANARQWTPGAGDAPVRLEPDLDALLANPAQFRGDLCRIAGRIQQQTPLAAPLADVTEWFVRDARGRPLLVYVVGAVQPDAFRDGQRVELYARFYKRVDDTARDLTKHSYAAFVGAAPAGPSGPAAMSTGPLAAVAIPVALLAPTFLAIFWYLRRARRHGSTRPPRIDSAPREVDDGPPLPDDPAAALDELRRRAEANGP